MDPPCIQFVVTPWRDSKELLQLRQDLYGSDDTKKERAVNKVSRTCTAQSPPHSAEEAEMQM